MLIVCLLHEPIKTLQSLNEPITTLFLYSAFSWSVQYFSTLHELINNHSLHATITTLFLHPVFCTSLITTVSYHYCFKFKKAIDVVLLNLKWGTAHKTHENYKGQCQKLAATLKNGCQIFCNRLEILWVMTCMHTCSKLITKLVQQNPDEIINITV